MPRPIWTGAISFGLVNVPVKLFTATSRQDIHFHQLHKTDGVRIKQKRVCPQHDTEVAFDEIVKGYEIAPGQYVVIEPSELDALDAQATHSIDIEEFVDLEQIDPVFFEHPYYLAPDARADKPYVLLREAMRDSNKVGLGRFVMRTKQYLAAIRAKEDVLVLSTMLFADEVVDPASIEAVPTAAAEVGDNERAMARQLIESLAADFDPGRYHDDYREKVQHLIERKAAGQEIVSQPAAEEPAKVVDLMAALEASLQAAREKKKSA